MVTTRAIIVIILIIILVALIGVFFYYSFSGSSTKIEENEKDLASESEKETKELTFYPESNELDKSKKKGKVVAQILGEFIDINTKKKVLYARITSLRDPRPQPARKIVPCELCDKLRGRRVSFGDFVWLEFDINKPDYYSIVYIVSTIDYGL